MKTVRVHLGHRSYNVYIGHNITKDIGILVPKRILTHNPILVVTNPKVRALAGKTLFDALKRINTNVRIEEIPDSERAKSFKVYIQIISRLSEIGKKTKPTIIALGGGVVGDVTGFAAATYRRGVPYIQMPTTLLAQVDSSIGGKVAIDIPKAKNLVGSFYQPACVISDLAFLATLPKKEIRNGLAEIIKYGIIYDSNFFDFIGKNLKDLFRLRRSPLTHTVWKSASIKAKMVSKDELDTAGIRAILNFGHTFAHAIETTFQYSKDHSHGESVSIGMVMASHLALRLGMICPDDALKIRDLLKTAGLRVRLSNHNIEKLMRAIQYDKKFLHGKNRFILPLKIGRVKIVEDIPDRIIRDVIRDSSHAS